MQTDDQRATPNLLLDGSAEIFREIVAASADAIIGIDINRRIIIFNKAAEELFGYSIEYVLGREIEYLLPPNARDIHARHVERFRKGDVRSGYMGDRSGDLEGQRADGTVFPVAVSIQNIKTSTQEIMVAHVRNIAHHVDIKKDLRYLASTDYLTQANNRRAFFNAASRIHEHCLREEATYAILLMDLTNFKQLNDAYGHNAGDFMLQEFSRVCQENLRTNDVFARWGGDEFILLMPRTDRDDALCVAHRLKDRWESGTLCLDGWTLRKPKVNMGLASWRIEDRLDGVINRADAALYASKLAGEQGVMVE